MSKIIWKKADFEQLKKQLFETHKIVLSKDPNDPDDDHVRLVVQEEDVEKLRIVLEMISLEKAKLVLETQHGWIQIFIMQITYLESFGENIYLHLESQPTEIIKQPLYQLEEMLKTYDFIRIGKSYIVNLAKIRYIRTGFNAKLDLELITGDHLEVSRSFVKSFKNALGIQKKED
jgi:DNA-binding LytR/AlgR family response regulator